MTTIVDVGEEVEWEGRANHDSDNMISLRDLIYQESEHEADCLLNNSSSKNDNDNIDDDDDDDSTASTRTLLSSSVTIIDNDDKLWDPSDPNEAAIIADVELIQRYLLNQNQHHQQQQHHHQ